MNKRMPFMIFLIVLLVITVICYIFVPSDDIVQEGGNVVMDSEFTADDIIEITINMSDVELIAKTVYGEARGCSAIEQSAVIWCILNRVDTGYGSIQHVVTRPYQFTGYSADNPVQDEHVKLAIDVLIRWQMEKYGIVDVGRTLPKEYRWFHGDGDHNYFRDKYNGDYNIWDWNCLNPYP